MIALIAGLGNPGPDYAATRHNVGFWLTDCIVAGTGARFSREPRFSGEVCKVSLEGRVVRLLKPTTMMNGSGRSVAALARYFAIPPASILLIHDELDIPPGDARLKFAGGHGGHNGLRDVISHLGSADFWRIRLGIGHPGHSSQVVSYVLKPPSRSDEPLIQEAVTAVLDVLPMIVRGETQEATNQLHSRRRR